MKKKRFTEQQIIGFLKEAEAGMPVKELCRTQGCSAAGFHRHSKESGALHASSRVTREYRTERRRRHLSS